MVTDADSRRTATAYDLAGQQSAASGKGGTARRRRLHGAAPMRYPAAIGIRRSTSAPVSDGRLRLRGVRLHGQRQAEVGQGRKQQRDRARVRQARPLALYAVSFSQLPAHVARWRIFHRETPLPAPSCSNNATYEELRYSSAGNPATAAGGLCAGGDQVCFRRTRIGGQNINKYDVMNRLATKAVTNLPTVTYTYNLLDDQLSLTSPVSSDTVIPAHRIAYGYDDTGRKEFEENTLNAILRKVAYTYDQAGNRRTTTWPDGYLVTYEYDVLNRMSEGPGKVRSVRSSWPTTAMTHCRDAPTAVCRTGQQSHNAYSYEAGRQPRRARQCSLRRDDLARPRLQSFGPASQHCRERQLLPAVAASVIERCLRPRQAESLRRLSQRRRSRTTGHGQPAHVVPTCQQQAHVHIRHRKPPAHRGGGRVRRRRRSGTTTIRSGDGYPRP